MMTGPKPALVAIEGGLSAVPPMPDTLSPACLDDWRHTAEALQKSGLLTDGVLPVLETYVGALWMTRECRRTIEAEGMTQRKRDGTLQRHPLVSMLRSSQETVTRLADELGLTPMAQARAASKAPVRRSDEEPGFDFGF